VDHGGAVALSASTAEIKVVRGEWFAAGGSCGWVVAIIGNHSLTSHDPRTTHHEQRTKQLPTDNETMLLSAASDRTTSGHCME